MHRMYREGALQVAKNYAEKHKQSGDIESQKIWLRVAEIIAEKQKDR